MAHTAVIWDPRYADHDTAGMPEGSDRIEVIVQGLHDEGLWSRIVEVRPQSAAEAEVLRVHTPAHLERIRRAAELRGGEWVDSDTYVSAQSFEVALLAVGGTLDALAQWQEGRVSFAAVRPPGHHATPDRAMGFCLFNNVAIAARRLLADGYERVAIVDWDAHHGNGTQTVFLAEREVLYMSLHQSPLFPGTGAVDEVGVDDGEGYTVNIPMPAGSGDGDYALAFQRLVEPIVDRFAPQAILVSVGFDTHAADPLTDLRMSPDGYAMMTLSLLTLAARHADGRLMFELEGGYDRPALALSAAAVVRTLLDERAPQVGSAGSAGQEAVERACAVQQRFWDL